MYAGTTISSKSGRIMGVHQRIDRVARKHLQVLLPDDFDFPSIKQILHFEGKNGPDGIKRKSPAVDEPWHFIDPDDSTDLSLVIMIEQHIDNLAIALINGSDHRAAFEAAWMAHAVTDGLTPAHHYPLEKALEELRGGQGIETRTSIIKKNMMSGKTPVEKLRNNWRFWGAKGIMMTHMAFEAGIASAITKRKFESSLPTKEDIEAVIRDGFRQYFLDCVRQINNMQIYENFTKSGWTNSLVKQVNNDLMPLIIKCVTLGWLQATWLSTHRDGK